MDILVGGSWKVYHAGDLTGSVTDEIKFVDARPPAGGLQLGHTESAGFAAYIVDAPRGDKRQVQYLFIESQGGAFRIEGLPLGHRPLGSPRWIGANRLQIDRWSNPHYGVRYVIDVQNRQLLSANAFADQHFIDTQRSATVIP